VKTKPTLRAELPDALANFRVGDSIIVSCESDRQESLRLGKRAISMARKIRNLPPINWRLRTWSNGDGTYTVMAVETSVPNNT
jgi:hypothetical protein